MKDKIMYYFYRFFPRKQVKLKLYDMIANKAMRNINKGKDIYLRYGSQHISPRIISNTQSR